MAAPVVDDDFVLWRVVIKRQSEQRLVDAKARRPRGKHSLK